MTSKYYQTISKGLRPN